MYAKNTLFEADFEAYSVKWTGASQAHPESEAVATETVAMEMVMAWAILSAEEAGKPVLTAFVLPWWDDKGSSHARWLYTRQCSCNKAQAVMAAWGKGGPLVLH